MNGKLYDPINVFCSIAIVSLHEPGTRLDLHNNTVAIQPPAASQGLSRFFRSSSRNDMYTLLFPAKRFIELTCIDMEIVAYRTPVHKPQSAKNLPPPPLFDLNNDSDDEAPNSSVAIGIPRSASGSSGSKSAKGSNKSAHGGTGSSKAVSGTNTNSDTSSNSNSSSINSSNSSNSNSNSNSSNSSNSNNKAVNDNSKSAVPMINHLYRNQTLRKLLRYYQSGIRALQKTYSEDNAEAALQQAYNVVGDAFDIADSGGDIAKAFRLLPPSCANYNSSIIDQTAVIKLWDDGTLQDILEHLEGYIKDPLPQNLLTCRSAVSILLTKKNEQYQALIAQGSK